MKKKLHKSNTHKNSPKKQGRGKWLLALFVLAVVGVITFQWSRNVSARNIHEKALKLGLRNAPPELEKRHVWITENYRTPPIGEDQSVHILFRADASKEWGLCGTGTLLGKFPNYILTAYHVFENIPGQYGYRKIGKHEFSGTERVLPIDSCAWGNGDDTIMARIGNETSAFSHIHVPESTNMWRYWEDKTYSGRIWPVKMRTLTYPDKEIQNVLQLEVKPGTFHFIFDWEPYAAESGTGAKIVGEQENKYLVLIRSQPFPAKMVNEILTRQSEEILNWKKGKRYGVGVLVSLTPPAL